VHEIAADQSSFQIVKRGGLSVFVHSNIA
jgi:hypothetical protein